MGRAYQSNCFLLGTTGGALSQTYGYTYDDGDGSLTQLSVTPASSALVENISFTYDGLKRLSRKTLDTASCDIVQNYTYPPCLKEQGTFDIVNFIPVIDKIRVLWYNYGSLFYVKILL